VEPRKERNWRWDKHVAGVGAYTQTAVNNIQRPAFLCCIVDDLVELLVPIFHWDVRFWNVYFLTGIRVRCPPLTNHLGSEIHAVHLPQDSLKLLYGVRRLCLRDDVLKVFAARLFIERG